MRGRPEQQETMVTFPLVPHASPANVRCSVIALCSQSRVRDVCLTSIAHPAGLVQRFPSPGGARTL